MVQLIIFVCSLLINEADISRLLWSIVIAVGSAAVQFAVACLKPGALGLGDVTCTLMAGLAVGWFGVVASLLWWCLMSVLGILSIAALARAKGSSIPFAPVITAAMFLTVIAADLWHLPL
jgi:leader peptidase (prepilin peptidase)/N-methyltransferase